VPWRQLLGAKSRYLFSIVQFAGDIRRRLQVGGADGVVKGQFLGCGASNDVPTDFGGKLKWSWLASRQTPRPF
jgi:hypothetical protein